ncbi:Iron-containing alcohol dehydrogenase [Novymonas esmeraldas]|uniref:Alcohol dehydrogenase 4 n=1 Tax=Novymonas esmeraldas TaxID=1808958 RepID=A0AAW0F9R2_9TRYP
MMRATRLCTAASAFYIPSVSFVGAGALKAAGPKILSLNFTHPLIVTDTGIRGSGLLDTVLATLKKDAGITRVTVFDDVQPNPTVANVNNGLKMLNESGCDSIISLGGGSPQDAAKGIAMVKTNGGKIEDLEGADKAKKPQFPLIAVNTTAGTASEMTRFAVITDEVRHVKMVIATDMCTPLVAVNDAELMLKMPKSLTAATGMDALTHAVEAYVSVGASLITDACALQAMRLIKQHLARATHHGSDVAAREGMSYAEFLAGMAFNSAGLGYVHAMAHQMGAIYNLPHGVCNAILLPHVEDYNKSVVPHRLRDVGAALGVNNIGRTDASAADAAIEAIRALSVEVEIPSGFKQLGAKEEDLPRLADAALLDVCAVFNPRQGPREDIIQIYRKAL